MNILTKKNAEILRFLYKKDSYIREIAEKLKISPGKVHSAVALFKKNNLVIEKKEKNRGILSLNSQNPALNSILNIIEEKTESKFRMKQRKKDSHKGENGRVLVIGGSRDYIGAPALAGIACLRAGADIVVVAAPEKTAWAINEISPDLITKKLKGDFLTSENFEELKGLIEECDVILLGPGIGRQKESKELVKRILKSLKPKVVDADAIFCVDLKEIRNAVITPHKTEFQFLLRNNNLTEDSLKNKLSNNIILLKGQTDKIISADKIILNKTGNEAMTKGGTGDVLAGITASFISQGNSLFESAHAAAFINGRAGENLKRNLGYGFLASELAEEIPKVIKEVLNG